MDFISFGTFRNLHKTAVRIKATGNIFICFQTEAPSHLPLSILWKEHPAPAGIWPMRFSCLTPSFPWQVRGNLALHHFSCFLSLDHKRAFFHHFQLGLDQHLVEEMHLSHLNRKLDYECQNRLPKLVKL